jgi:hypothetical protein
MDRGATRILPVSYETAQPGPIARGQVADPVAPYAAPPPAPPIPAPPPGVPVPPPNPGERYNCGVVAEPPASTHPFLDGCNHYWDKTRNFFTGLTAAPLAGQGWFQSDHCFDQLASPVSNPFLFEDPRSLTEIKPLYMEQGTPSSNFIFHGGDIEFAGVQARLAITERFSLVLSELGEVWMEPHNSVDGFSPSTGFAEIRVGPKYTFYRCESSGTIAAAGVNFDIPAGSSKTFQNTGNLSIEPYISFGQTFWRTSYGTFDFLNTTGYNVATDDRRTDFLFSSFHLDYDVAGLHKIYPFIEANYFHYTKAGNGLPLGFEGRDLFNFGAGGVSGNNTFTVAPGIRYKFNECLQTGVAVELPASGHRDLIDYRVTVDVIFRF